MGFTKQEANQVAAKLNADGVQAKLSTTAWEEKRGHNPATTEGQRKLFGIARAITKGETPASYSPQAAKIAKTVPVKKIREFAGGVKKKRR